MIYGESLKTKSDLYETPFKSSFLDIYKSDEQRTLARLWDIDEVLCKLFRIKINSQESAYFPLLHSL